MSLEAARKSEELVEHEQEHGHEPYLAHQFEDRSQQDESYVVGMWTFLVTEILFFGALFLAYSLFRILYPEVYVDAHHYLNPNLGALNTFFLLTSSLTMAMAVYCAQIEKRMAVVGLLVVTCLFAAGFLFVKLGFEWWPKWQEGLVPGPYFHYPPEGPATVDPNKAMLFFGLYFAMTGLHGIHVLIGIIIMAVLGVMILMNRPSTRYYMPIEMTGLYWHFVDIVWIFLFPLFYLIGK